MSLVVGENLRQLSAFHKICPDESYDVFSLKLTLCPDIFLPINLDREIDYANADGEDFYEQTSISPDGIVLAPGACFLGCSHEQVRIPVGFFGNVQTKGSLARLFISVHQTDCQIEPGFEGAITFEITNNSKHKIRLRRYDNIAQLFIWTCTTDNTPPYNGRYSGSKLPTLKVVKR
ncbi:MAG TPA: hypothetical protein VGO22_23625 [Pseudorhizobium sp.]|jgi:deoxycytidine triphosphate deaminase|nr:hypothetical protein [Pseudorhizobium sp.]